MNRTTDRLLVSDCGGLVEDLALCIPAAFFSDARSGKSAFRPLVPIGNLLASLPDGVRAHIFVDQSELEGATGWAGTLPLCCSVTVVPVGFGQNLIASPWMQDLVQVCIVHGQSGEGTEIAAATGNVLATAIAKHLQMRLSVDGLVLPGGNQLIGQTFRLMGASEVVERLSFRHGAGVDPARWDAIAALDPRGMCVFGYRVSDLSHKGASVDGVRPVAQRDPAADHSPFVFGRVHQCGFHVDQFVTITGLFSDGCPLLVVADPVSADGTRDRFNEALKRQLDASVLLLQQQGFVVVRNPMPLMPSPDIGKRLPRLYNNVLLENACRSGLQRPLVWVPQFGDVEPLEEFDRQNLAVWQQLGFDPVPVLGWSHLASRNGAIRCVAKVVRRRNP